MSSFRYEAINYVGETVNGEMEAATSDVVVEHLQRLGYVPLIAEPKRTGWLAHVDQKSLFGSKHISSRDIALFTRELATMLQAGLPLEQALGTLVEVDSKPHMKAFLNDALLAMRSGKSFADSLAKKQSMLPKAYVEMIRAGELGGGDMLKFSLNHMADYLDKMQHIRETIVSAMIYPAIVLAMAVLSISLMLIFVLPQFEPLFAPAGESLPLSARIVIAAGHGLRDYGLAGFILIVTAIVIAKRYVQRHDYLQLRLHSFLLRLPKIGSIIRKTEIAKFCRTLGSLQTSGVILATALPIAVDGLSNKVFAQSIGKIAAKVREGQSLSSPLIKEKLFPPLALQMIKIGEETGRLDAMLLKIAEIYDRDTQSSIERLMALLVPAMTIGLGVIIAFIIAAILSAILSVNDLVT